MYCFWVNLDQKIVALGRPRVKNVHHLRQAVLMMLLNEKTQHTLSDHRHRLRICQSANNTLVVIRQSADYNKVNLSLDYSFTIFFFCTVSLFVAPYRRHIIWWWTNACAGNQYLSRLLNWLSFIVTITILLHTEVNSPMTSTVKIKILISYIHILENWLICLLSDFKIKSWSSNGYPMVPFDGNIVLQKMSRNVHILIVSEKHWAFWSTKLVWKIAMFPWVRIHTHVH